MRLIAFVLIALSLLACSANSNAPKIQRFTLDSSTGLNLISRNPETGETYAKFSWDIAGEAPMSVVLEPFGEDVSETQSKELANLKIDGVPIFQDQVIVFVLQAKNAFGTDQAELEVRCCHAQ
jgi:hypothetical protein